MNKILLLCFMFLLAFTFSESWAQENTVSGKVTSSDDGSVLPGVNVVFKGTSTGTITDFDGNYSLAVPESGTVLVFSFVGFKSFEVTIGDRSVVDVQMESDYTQLDEVVVVAYGEESVQKLTGSVAKIDTKVIQQQQLTNVANALQGTVAGVNVIQSSGQPGSSPTIRIRGVSSIDSDNSPLIVVDGAVYSSHLNTINQDDIESISVLKDASASALYGSRAANGVIMITTKRGKVGKPVITFNASTGVSERAVKDYEYLSAKEQMLLEWEAIRNDAVDFNSKLEEDGATQGFLNPGEYARDELLGRIGYNPFGNNNAPFPIDENGIFTTQANTLWDTDWEKEIFTRQAVRKDYNLGVSGGSESIRYYLGGSYLDQEGQVDKSDFVRYSGRANIDAELNDWLTLGLRQTITFSEQNNPTQDGTTYGNTIQYIRTMSPIYPVFKRDENGEFILDASGQKIYDTGDDYIAKINGDRPVLSPGNTVGQTQLNEVINKRFNSISNVYLQINFLKDFNFKTNYSYNKYVFDYFAYTNPLFGSAKSVNGRINRYKNISTEWTITNSLNWSKGFNGHNFNVMLLQEAYDYKHENLETSKTGLPFDGLYEYNSASTLERMDGYTSQERIASLMGQFKYDYNNRYLFTASFRQDQSSRFAKDFRKGNFYSTSLGWNLSQESFLKEVSFLELLKVRASYGQLGNSKIIDDDGNQIYFPYLTNYETGFDQPGYSGIYPSGLSNSSLTWEKVTTTNLGLDFALFNNRFFGSLDVYKAVTDGLITDETTTISRGVRGNSITKNVGEVTNTGLELVLGGDVIANKNFNWNISFNIAFEKNEITDFPEKERINGTKKLMEGKSIYDFFIAEWAGVDPETGKPQWYTNIMDPDDENKVLERKKTFDYDSANSATSKAYFGSALPFARGGIKNSFTFKGFDLSFLFNYSLGGQIIDYDYSGTMHSGRRAGQNYNVDSNNRWQKMGDITDVPRQSTNDRANSTSTRFLFDATYFRLRNVTFGYSLPSTVLKKQDVLKNVRIFAMLDNYLTFFGRQGLDPEQSIQGTTDNRSSVFKTASFGVNMTF